jgi:pantoate--beta-alanine ligase
MLIARKIRQIQKFMEAECGGKTVGFVPTMGDLHEGHLSLIRRSERENRFTVISIFVNPRQFNDRKDFLEYRRNEKADLVKAKDAGADALFIPEEKEIYPPGFRTSVSVNGLSGVLCGPFRPGHFTGVATVVAKLFNVIRPTRAYFGMKDYQQVKIIERMVKDLNLEVRIVCCPTIREPDGLALSSRNARLSPSERSRAARIFQSLQHMADLVESTQGISARFLSRRFEKELMLSRGDRMEYLQAVDPETLEPVRKAGPPVLLAAAVWIGKTRLIDSLLLK